MSVVEIRSGGGAPRVRVAFRAEGHATVVSGLGVPYNAWSEDLGGFRERIARGAFTESIATGDVRALWSHDAATPLGRHRNGTLRLEERADGLHYEVDVNPEDVIATSVAARIRRGDVTGSSFGFIVRRREDQEWTERDGVLWRTIHRAELREVSPVVWPAYPQSRVGVGGKSEALRRALASGGGRSTPVDQLRRRRLRAEQDASLALMQFELDEMDADYVRARADAILRHERL